MSSSNSKYNGNIRQQILDLIKKNPGIYVKEIKSLLNISPSAIEAYLLILERDHIIVNLGHEGNYRYYIKKQKTKISDARVSEIREKIYEIILQNPGIHLSKIAEMLDIRISLTEYHLKYLEKKEKIRGIREGDYYKRYYIESSGFGVYEKKLISILRQETSLKIILFLLKHPNSKHKSIQKMLGISPPLLSYHLRKLVQEEIIQSPSFESKGYSLKNKKEIIQFLKKLKVQAIFDSFSDIWQNLDYYDR